MKSLLLTIILIVSTITVVVQCSVASTTTEKLLRIVTGGLPQIVWQQILLDKNDNHPVSTACNKAINTIRQQFNNGDAVAFRYLDASARTTAGFMIGSMSAFGDYDQCLEIKHDDAGLRGQYCMVMYRFDARSMPKTNISGELLANLPPGLYYEPYHALCIPAACSLDDVKALIDSTTSGFYFRDVNITHCDTQHSLDTRLNRLTTAQQVSIVILVIMISIVLSGTLLSLLGFESWDGFNLVKNFTDLFVVDDNVERIQAADFAKTTFAVVSVILHSILCAATPVGAYLLIRLKDIENSVSSIWLQPFFNVAMLTFLAFFSGVVIGWATIPAARKKQLSYFNIILQRVLKFVPGLAFLVCLEFVWPLIGEGPMYTLEANDVIHDCTGTWWKLLLFIVNWNYILDNCANQTFWFAVDMQLFVLALFCVYLFTKNRRYGIIFCLVMCVIDFVVTGYVSVKYETRHTAASVPLDVRKSIEFFDRIYYKTFNYLFGHFSGILVGEHLTTQNPIKFGKTVFVFSMWLANLCAYSSSAYNTWPDLLPQWTIPYYLAITKALIVLAFTLITLSAGSLSEKKPKKPTKDGNPTLPKLEREIYQYSSMSGFYNLFIALTRLAIPLNITNYYFIRYDFFSSRLPFETRMFSFYRRFFYSLAFSMMLATMFHLFFMAPCENLRKKFFSNKKKEETSVESKKSN